ncbi:MAG: tRNA (adenosine(37)-N6)-threonylcarbamoyltransferase complex ATPase subunit type 1 TsaE, partial [Proteobacteria bacterium]|nr:tRNA (adenosine(37)-N6)-threonylcarbamoyltransferase complex ATPase subunit type 1 TsaE [Pseudomonadota bacterium]
FTAAGYVHHLDLYRIQTPDEVDGLALRDRSGGDSILLIEWPERGIGALPSPSWEVSMGYHDSGRTVCITRR